MYWKLLLREQFEADGEWITINGRHVLIGGEFTGIKDIRAVYHRTYIENTKSIDATGLKLKSPGTGFGDGLTQPGYIYVSRTMPEDDSSMTVYRVQIPPGAKLERDPDQVLFAYTRASHKQQVTMLRTNFGKSPKKPYEKWNSQDVVEAINKMSDKEYDTAFKGNYRIKANIPPKYLTKLSK